MTANARSPRLLLSVPATAMLLVVTAGCGSGPGQSESQMTSYSSGENKADTANLFTVPSDQMAHIQVVTVEKSNVPRALHLTGAVAYNGFKTTPVFSAVGGPVQEIRAEPGQNVHLGQTLLTVASPDYSAARSAYLKANSVPKISTSIKPSPSVICSRRNPTAPRPRPICNRARMR